MTTLCAPLARLKEVFSELASTRYSLTLSTYISIDLIVLPEFAVAEATNCTSELTVAPPAGEVMVTLPGDLLLFEVAPTVMLSLLLYDFPDLSQATMVTL